MTPLTFTRFFDLVKTIAAPPSVPLFNQSFFRSKRGLIPFTRALFLL
jgi:hypothetical protein